MIIPLAPALLAGSSNLPEGFGRAVLERLPIWSCSVRGFACHFRYQKRGALLPHLFTLTRLRPRPSGPRAAARQAPVCANVKRACLAGARGAERRERRRAVCFLCHFPSGCPARVLPGALPCGVRTFLSRARFVAPKLEARSAESEGGRLRTAAIIRPTATRYCRMPAGIRAGTRQGRAFGAGGRLASLAGGPHSLRSCGRAALTSFARRGQRFSVLPSGAKRRHFRAKRRERGHPASRRRVASRKRTGRTFSTRPSPAKSDTAPASCRDCCAVCRSPRPSSRYSTRSRAAW